MAKHDNLEDELESILSESVPFISPKELHSQMQRNKPVLLDIRSKREHDVSYIPGSRFIEYDEFKESDVAKYSRTDTVILYCAVGYRSEKIGEKLQAMGFTNVYNLYGGIFEWKNEGFEVVDTEGNKTDQIHTYSESWSQYLKKGTKIYD